MNDDDMFVPSVPALASYDPTTTRAFNTKVGKAIRRARLARSWTQETLAQEALLIQNHIARLERGEMGMSLFVATRLAAVLRIPLDELVDEQM